MLGVFEVAETPTLASYVGKGKGQSQIVPHVLDLHRHDLERLDAKHIDMRLRRIEHSEDLPVVYLPHLPLSGIRDQVQSWISPHILRLILVRSVALLDKYRFYTPLKTKLCLDPVVNLIDGHAGLMAKGEIPSGPMGQWQPPLAPT